MGRTPWAAYLWPGLPQLWRRGSWSALALAVGSAGMVNVALAASLLWSELLPPRVRTGAWVAVGVLWLGSAAFSRLRERHEAAAPGNSPAGDLYVEAMEHYLKGNWFESECRLRELLRHNPRDLDAGLMLATLLRHTGRLPEASQQLDRLERFDGWERWAMEIGRERAALAAARDEGAEEPEPGPAQEPEGPGEAEPEGVASCDETNS